MSVDSSATEAQGGTGAERELAGTLRAPTQLEPARPSTRTVPQRIDSLIARLRTARLQSTFAIVSNEIQALRRDYSPYYAKVALTRYREEVGAALGSEHPSLKYLHSFRADMVARNDESRDKAFALHAEMRPIDPDEMLDRAVAHLDDHSYGNKVAALVLVTGRRPVEIAYSGEFAPIEGRRDALLFAGQAMQKGGTEKPPYVIPVLADAIEVMHSLELVRAQRSFSEPRDVNAKAGKELTQGAGEVFGVDGAGDAQFTPSELRKAYATIAHHFSRDEPGPRLSQHAYVASVLGHNSDDVQTAMAHLTYFVDGSFSETLQSFRAGLPDLQRGTEARLGLPDLSKNAIGRIENDLERVRELLGAIPAPELTESDRIAIRSLSRPQREMLRDVLDGKTTYHRGERATAEALVNRELAYSPVDRDRPDGATPPIALTERGTQLAAQLAVLVDDRLEPVGAAARAAQPPPGLSALPPSTPPPARAVVRERESYRATHEQIFVARSRSDVDGHVRVVGTVGSMILSAPADAFSGDVLPGATYRLLGEGATLRADEVGHAYGSPLPVVDVAGTEQREYYPAALEQRIEIVGRSEDGQRIYGRNGSGTLSVPASAFTRLPRVGDAVTVRGAIDALEITIAGRGRELER